MSRAHAADGLRAKRIAEAVCAELGGEVADLLSPTRKHPEDAFRRAIAMAVFHANYSGGSMAKTGRAFGRHHSTVSHALDRVAERVNGTGEADAALRSALRAIRAAI